MLKVDLHTHSIASGHAFNTIYEMVSEAKERGIKLIGMTEHGPAMGGAPYPGYFSMSDEIDELYGVKVLLGIEANILSKEGKIDLSDELLKKQGIVLAGLHSRTPYQNNSLENNTLATINAMRNPLVQIISHPYHVKFPVDIKKVFDEATQTKTLLELNNRRFYYEASNESFLNAYRELVEYSKKYGYPLIIGSDAHVAKKIGEDSSVMAVSDQIGLTSDILLNSNPEELTKWMKKK